MLPGETTVVVVGGSAATVNFKLDWINPGPTRLESRFSGEAPDLLPLNGGNYLSAGEIDPGVQVVDGAIYDPGKSGFQSLSIDSWTGRTTHFDIDEIEAMDETKGAAVMNLPADAVREVIVSRVTPEVFQSLNGNGAVSVTATRSGGDVWHGDLFGNLRDQFLASPVFRGQLAITAVNNMVLALAADRYQREGVCLPQRRAHETGWPSADRGRISRAQRHHSARAPFFARTC